MTLAQLDYRLYIDLLILSTYAAWEAYPPAIPPDVEPKCSTLLMWLRMGEGE